MTKLNGHIFHDKNDISKVVLSDSHFQYAGHSNRSGMY